MMRPEQLEPGDFVESLEDDVAPYGVPITKGAIYQVATVEPMASFHFECSACTHPCGGDGVTLVWPKIDPGFIWCSCTFRRVYRPKGEWAARFLQSVPSAESGRMRRRPRRASPRHGTAAGD
jgi:hypothetical protein